MKRLALVTTLLIGFLASCEGGLSDVGTPATLLPAELVGAWSSGGVSSTNFYDPNTGSWGSPSGTGAAFTFGADGSFVYYQLDQVSLYGCTTSVLGYSTGTVTLEGAALTLYTNEGTVKYEDACGETTEKPIDPRVYPYTYMVDPDASGNETLFLTWTDGSVSEYRRE